MTILPRHLDACEVTSLGNWLIQFGVAAAIVNLETRADYGVNSRYYMMSQPFSAHFIFYYLFIYLLNWSPVVFLSPFPFFALLSLRFNSVSTTDLLPSLEVVYSKQH